MITTLCRIEDCIISTIDSGKKVFGFRNTSWDLKKDKNYLVDALKISLAQMKRGLYYGRHSKATIEYAICHLTLN